MRKKIKLLDGSLSYPIEEKGYKLNTNLWTGEILIKNPEVIEDIPHILDINVVLPAPFGPNNAMISPLKILRFTSSKATLLSLYIFLRFLISIIVCI